MNLGIRILNVHFETEKFYFAFEKIFLCTPPVKNPWFSIFIRKSKKIQSNIDISKKLAELYYCNNKAFPFTKAVTSFFSYLLYTQDVLVFHASSVVKNDGAVLFCGEQGVGKTTVSVMSGLPRYSDDAAFIRKSGNTFLLYPTPFETSKIYARLRKPLKIRCLYFLHQGSRNIVNRMHPYESVIYASRNLFSNFLNVSNQAVQKACYTLLSDFVGNVPMRQLYFNRDIGFLQSLLEKNEGKI